MWPGPISSVALTIDDAPSVSEPSGPAFDAGRMDRIREVVLGAGVRHCVAFVIGERARGQKDALRRWLDAGFELGNHTQDHVAASAVDADRFIGSARSCHELLLDAGAFENGRRRFFRHPFGDRGPAGDGRRAIAGALAELGYAPAEVTVDLYDYAYDPVWARAQATQPDRAERIETRWLDAATASLERATRHAQRAWGPDFVQVAACHFGPVTEHRLAELVLRHATRLRWARLADAMDNPRYRALLGDTAREGTPADLASRGLRQRVLRRVARVAHRLEALGGAPLGPRWPHLDSGQ